jgi:hypothetical protein
MPFGILNDGENRGMSTHYSTPTGFRHDDGGIATSRRISRRIRRRVRYNAFAIAHGIR